MGHLIKRSRCPECAKRGADKAGDNLATYSDGHSYCYACGYVHSEARIRLTLDKVEKAEEDIEMPEDALPIYSAEALDWLYQYDFDYTDVIRNNLLYSEARSLLIFPYVHNNELYAWQGRYFGHDRTHPKWWNRGNFRKHFLINNEHLTTDKLILVEDVVSWMKIGKFGYKVCCLFGCSPSKEQISKLGVKHHLVWWLDMDKAKESVKYRRTCEALGISSSNIFTTLDPKELSYTQIRSKIDEV